MYITPNMCKKYTVSTAHNFKVPHHPLKVPYHPLQSTIPPSSKYYTTLFKVPHQPLQYTVSTAHNFAFFSSDLYIHCECTNKLGKFKILKK